MRIWLVGEDTHDGFFTTHLFSNKAVAEKFCSKVPPLVVGDCLELDAVDPGKLPVGRVYVVKRNHFSHIKQEFYIESRYFAGLPGDCGADERGECITLWAESEEEALKKGAAILGEDR